MNWIILFAKTGLKILAFVIIIKIFDAHYRIEDNMMLGIYSIVIGLSFISSIPYSNNKDDWKLF
jgi:hypothetical protein